MARSAFESNERTMFFAREFTIPRLAPHEPVLPVGGQMRSQETIAMPRTPGTKLGHYEVVESVGAGGMGEVYRAHDTKLGRDVAIKVLPEEFARDKRRLDRFDVDESRFQPLQDELRGHVDDAFAVRWRQDSAESGNVGSW